MIRTLSILCLFVGSAALAFPSTAHAVDVRANVTDVTFGISHPAKEYEAKLLPGGAKITVSVDPTDLAKTGIKARISVDKFNSDNSRRDSHMMEVLEGLIYPHITWKVTKLRGVSGPVKVGTYTAYGSGPLDVHGVTKTLDAKLGIRIAKDGTITITSSFSISLEAFDIERPTLVFVPIADNVPIQVTAKFPGGSAIFPAQ